MKFHVTELSTGKKTPHGNSRKLLLLPLILILFTIIPLLLSKISHSPLPTSKISISDLRSIEGTQECDIFRGKWLPYPKGPYYTNATCDLIFDQQNCMKLGRPDTDYMKWKWKPEGCELPLFDAEQFLELVRGKSMAFVGDSVGWNQMQSLLCLLSSVAHPEDITRRYTSDTTYFKRWYYNDYRFTLAAFWSPFLIKAKDADPNGHSLNSLMNLDLDQADEAWASQIETFDYVIFSAGNWFFRPLIYRINGQVVGCHSCGKENITSLSKYYGYKMAFRSAFETLPRLKGYKGITFLRTYSPSHFENGAWNEGGSCPRTRPLTRREMKVDGYIMEFYSTQAKELRKAEKEGKKRGLKYFLLATTEAMLMRPDGHPNQYGYSLHRNVTAADCVHWCLPGPIDTWNEFLLYILKMEAQRSYNAKLKKIA